MKLVFADPVSSIFVPKLKPPTTFFQDWSRMTSPSFQLNELHFWGPPKFESYKKKVREPPGNFQRSIFLILFVVGFLMFSIYNLLNLPTFAFSKFLDVFSKFLGISNGPTPASHTGPSSLPLRWGGICRDTAETCLYCHAEGHQRSRWGGRLVRRCFRLRPKEDDWRGKQTPSSNSSLMFFTVKF